MNKSRKPKVLYVDDEVINLQLFQFTFERSFEVETAISIAEGFERIEIDPSIELLISDLKMPEMDGISFIKMVKKIRPDLPCILLSGYEKNRAIDEALKSKSIDDYILKPFKKAQVENCINTILSNS